MDRADLGEILDGLDLTDASAMAAARQEYEDALDTALERVTEEFLTGVIEDAVEALSSATLVAAGQPRGAGGRFVADPFSFTQVMKRWRAGIRQLESLTDLSEQSVRMILDGSDLPQWAFDDVSEALRRADEEGWTALRTKRELGAILIPRDDRGRWDSRARYRANIRMIARTLATENYSLRMTGTLATMGFELKEWVSRHDSRTRVSHAIADGQRVRLGDRFIVGASRMLYPGDPAAPIEETANCRCVLVGANLPKKGRKMNSTARKQARRVAAEGQAQPRLFEAAPIDTYAELAADEDVKEAEDEAAEEVAEEVESEPDGEGPDLVMWHGVIGMEKTMTGDGRLIEENALRWEDLPIPLRYVSQDVGGHGGAEVVGTIQVIEREEDGRILGTGTMDAQSPVGQEAIRQVAEGLNRGVSMDLDDVSFEVRVAEDVLAAHEAMLDGDGSDTEARAVVDGKVVMLEMSSDDEVHVTTSARIRAATIVSIPAFAEAQIDLVDDDDTLSDEEAIGALDDDDEISEDEIEETYNWVDDVGGLPGYIRRIADHLMASGMTESRAIASAVNTVKRWARGGTVRRNGGPRVSAKTAAKAAAAVAEWEAKKIRARASSAGTSALSLTASGGPLAPPAAWFEDPQLSEPTALQITSEGRVYGHLAVWDACHIAHPQECVSPPSSPSGYAYFHTGALLTAEGTEVAIGHLTMDTGHAADQDSAMAALAHYDNSGTVGADIRVGEDAYGIWVAGGVRPGVSDEKLRSLRAAPISGDWRRLQGSLELVAALAVNVPGFAVPRPHGRRQNGNTVALVASGMVPPRRVKRPGTEGALSESDLRYLRALARREKRQQAQEMARQIRRDRVEAVARELGH